MANDFKTTAILLVSAVLISLYAYFFERDPPDWDRGVGIVFDQLQVHDFAELELRPGKRATETSQDVASPPVTLRYEQETPNDLRRWHIVEPFHFPAFTPRVEGIVRSIVELQRIALAAPEGGGDAIFDPESLEMTVRFKTRGSRGEQHTIEIGRDYPEEALDLAYVRVDGKDTFLARRRLKKSVNSRLDDLRSRALFPVPKERAIKLEIHRGGEKATVLERELGTPDWRLSVPQSGLADRTVVGQVLDELNSWRIESFVTDELKDPADYGFSKPLLVVHLTASSGKTYRKEIAKDPLGELKDEVYVRDPDRPFVFRAKEEILKWVDRPVEDFRSRFLLQLGAAKIVEVEGTVVSGGESRKFRLWREEDAKQPQGASQGPGRGAEKSAKAFPWKVQDFHLNSTYGADPVVTSDFVRTLEVFPVHRYLNDSASPEVFSVLSGRAKPVLTLNLTLDAGASISVPFFPGPSGEDFPENSYLVTRDGEVAMLATTMPQDLTSGGIHFRDRRLSGFSAGAVQRFEVESGLGIVWELARFENTWRVLEDDHIRVRKDKSVDQLLVRRVVRGFSRDEFRVAGYLADENDLEKLELRPGRYRMRVWFKDVRDHQGFRQVTIGARRDQSPGQESYARIDIVEDMPVLLPHHLVEDLLDLLEHLESITERR